MARACVVLTLGLCCLSIVLAEEVVVTVKEERGPIGDERKDLGLVVLKRHLSIGNAGIRYQRALDVQNGDALVSQRYGDYILGCEFPRWSWNWDLEYFLEVMVTRPGEQAFSATRATLQEGIYPLQQGPRGVADMVWPLGGKDPAQTGRLVVRLVKPGEDPNWMFVRVSLEGEPEARITQVRLSSYPVITSGPPDRQRWVETASRALQMGNQPQALDPATEWALAMHNKYAHEEGGSLLVVDPAQIAGISVQGVYPVSVTLTPSAERAITVAMGYFWDTPWEKAVAEFKSQMAERLARLRGVDWTVPVDWQRWERERAEVAQILKLLPDEGFRHARWAELQAEGDKTLAELRQPQPEAAAYRRFVVLMRRVEELKNDLYQPAIAALIEAATK